MMRILHVVPSYLPATRYGGPIRSVHGLAKAQAALGHTVHVHTTPVDGPDTAPVPLEQAVMREGVAVWYFPVPRLRRLYYAPHLARALRQQIHNFDVLHLHSVFLWPTWAAARIARQAGVPYVLAPRGMLVPELIRRKSRWRKTAWLMLIERHNLAHAAAIHVTTPLEAEDLARLGYQMPPTLLLPNGVEPLLPAVTPADLPPAVQALPADQPLILFLGRVHWKKGLDRLLPALAQVPEARLLIVGNDEEGEWPKLAALAATLGITGRILRLEAQTGRAKQALYQRAEVFVLPSYSENFGITVIEALQAGCPVVVTPEVGLAPAIAAQDCGLVSAGTPEALAAALRRLLADPLLRQALARRGRHWVDAEFSWPGLAARSVEFYRSLPGVAPCPS